MADRSPLFCDVALAERIERAEASSSRGARAAAPAPAARPGS